MKIQNSTRSKKIARAFLIATIVLSVASAVTKFALYWKKEEDLF